MWFDVLPIAAGTCKQEGPAEQVSCKVVAKFCDGSLTALVLLQEDRSFCTPPNFAVAQGTRQAHLLLCKAVYNNVIKHSSVVCRA